jgi:hypothetical protein
MSRKTGKKVKRLDPYRKEAGVRRLERAFTEVLRQELLKL